MKKNNKIAFLTSLLSFFVLTFSLVGSEVEGGGTIPTPREEGTKESRELASSAFEFNRRFSSLTTELKNKYQIVKELYHQQKEEEEFKKLLKEVNEIKRKITALEEEWRELSVSETKREEEGYGLWDQVDLSLDQLIMEYGSGDFLYLIPQELSSMKIQMHSMIPIPRESWNDLLEVILSHNGVGFNQINAYTRQLYLFKNSLTSASQVLTDPKGLLALSDQERLIFIFSPPLERTNEAFQFFERFRDSKKSYIYPVGHKVAIVSTKKEIKTLLTLYHAIWGESSSKVTRFVSLSRLSPEEMEKILTAYLGGTVKEKRKLRNQDQGEEFSIIPIKGEKSLVLIGSKSLVDQMERLVKDLEGQILDPAEMVVYWYQCRHSNPVEMAETLERIYLLLLSSVADESGVQQEKRGESSPTGQKEVRTVSPSISGAISDARTPPLSTLPLTENVSSSSPQMTHFIPHPKTGSLMIVVRKSMLDKVKALLEQLDIPPKMVQIDVLLFEKKSKNQNHFGLNKLKIDSETPPSMKSEEGMHFTQQDASAGIIDFFVRRPATQTFSPGFDIVYQCLLSQEDMQLNAAPCVTTLNQTPAQISITREISIDSGVVPIGAGESKKIAWEKSYTRTQYGTTLTIVPTIHEPDGSEEGMHHITLETKISFDSIQKYGDQGRPPVCKRYIENRVCVRDGESAILGGLREKVIEDSGNKIPFLGELPGVGKFFSFSKLSEERTEMFIFITPRVILGSQQRINQQRQEQLKKRPGDLPEFLASVQESERRTKKYLFHNSLKMFFKKVGDQ